MKRYGWVFVGLGLGFWAMQSLMAPPPVAAVAAKVVLPRAVAMDEPAVPQMAVQAEAEKLPEAEPPPTREEISQEFVDANLLELERMKEIPGAAPLIEEIVEFLKNDSADAFSLDNIPTNERGLAELDDEALAHLLPNPELRAKWDKLMALVAAQPDAVGGGE